MTAGAQRLCSAFETKALADLSSRLDRCTQQQSTQATGDVIRRYEEVARARRHDTRQLARKARVGGRCGLQLRRK